MFQILSEHLIVIFYGLVLGSFASALSWRIPRGESWVTHRSAQRTKHLARSQCPHCKKPLKVQDLVPFFSWVFLKGRCRYCRKKIDWRYPVIELSTMVGAYGVYLVWGFTAPAFIIIMAIPFLVAMIDIDLRHMILPNQLVMLSAAAALILIIYQYVAFGSGYGFGAQAISKLIGSIVYAGLVWSMGFGLTKILKKEALGMGDVKFFAMAGLWLGISYLPFFLLAAGVFGVFMGGFYRFYLKKQVFPFGPALIFALYTGLLLQGLDIVPLIGVQ